MTLKARVITRLPAANSPAEAGPRGQAKQKIDMTDRKLSC